MGSLSSLGIGSPHLADRAPTGITLLWQEHTLYRVMNFLGYSKGDLRDDSYARFRVREFYDLAREIERRCAELAEQPYRGKIIL